MTQLEKPKQLESSTPVSVVSGTVLAYGVVWLLKHVVGISEQALDPEFVLFLGAICIGPAAWLSRLYRNLGAV